MDAAQAFFREAVAINHSGWPTKVNLDGNAASHRALRLLGNEDPKWKPVVVRCCRYLNNIVEQDHRAIKRRCASMLGLKSFDTAATTFAGIELANRIRKGQFSVGRDAQCDHLSLKELWDLLWRGFNDWVRGSLDQGPISPPALHFDIDPVTSKGNVPSHANTRRTLPRVPTVSTCASHSF